MTKQTHIFCVPFPGAGHAVNMFNAAVLIANEDITAHVLVLSEKDGQKWMKATGQEHNPKVGVNVLANGKWEDWHPLEPRELVMQIRSPEFTEAIGEKIREVRQNFPSDSLKALIINPIMGTLPDLAKENGLQTYILNPTAGKIAPLFFHTYEESYSSHDTSGIV